MACAHVFASFFPRTFHPTLSEGHGRSPSLLASGNSSLFMYFLTFSFFLFLDSLITSSSDATSINSTFCLITSITSWEISLWIFRPPGPFSQIFLRSLLPAEPISVLDKGLLLKTNTVRIHGLSARFRSMIETHSWLYNVPTI